MDNNFDLLLTTLLTTLFTAGSLGFINCFILEKLDVLTFSKSNQKDKKHFSIFFSLLNFVMYLSIYTCTKSIVLTLTEKDTFTVLKELFIILCSILFTLIITICLSLYVFPKASEKFSEILNGLRKKKNLSEVDHRSPRDIVLDNDKKQSVFIFDFNKTLISSGIFKDYSIDSDYYEIILLPFDEDTDLDDYCSVKIFSESKEGQEKDIKILIDFEKKIQYFIISDVI